MSAAHRRRSTAAGAALAGAVLGVVAGVAALLVTGSQASASVSCSSGVWTARYWADATLSGTPKATRCDTAVDENWDMGHPAGLPLPNDNFSVRWTIGRNFGGGGPFDLTAAGQDGMRVWVDGTKYVDLWHNYLTTQTRTVRLQFAPGWHSLRVDYAAFTGRAKIRVSVLPSATGDRTPPAAPAGVRAALADPVVTVSWRRNVEADLAGYRVYRSTTYPFALDTAHYRGSTTATATTYRDTPPANGARYYYAVVARDRSGNQSRPTVVGVVSRDHVAPAAPTGTTTTFADPAVALSWASNTEPDLAGYRVYRRSAATAPWTAISGATPVAVAAWHDTPPLTGETYTYAVAAVDTAGNVSPAASAAALTTPDRTPPPAPTGLTGAATEQGTTVTWVPGTTADTAGYRVYRGLTSPVPLDAGHAVSGAAALTGASFTDTTTVRAVRYQYAVVAVDPAGNASVPATTAPDPLPAPPPPALHVAGNRLAAADGTPFVLHGVNHSGTEYGCVQGRGIFDGPSDAASVQAMLTWHVNTVRVPLNEDCWLGLTGVATDPDTSLTGAAYRQAVKDYVALLHQHGLVAVLDLHWNEGSYTGPGHLCADAAALCLKPMPDAAHATDFWTSVATAFRDDPATVFDLMNEPYPDMAMPGDGEAAWTCWRDGGSACSALGYDAVGMQALVDAVRATGATNVVVAGGLRWANDLSGWLAHRPTDPTGNLAAGWHAYSFNQCAAQDCWDALIAPVADQVPLVVGEIGEDDCGSAWISGLMPWLDAHQASYTAWTWNTWPGQCATGPVLIAAFDGTPTPYGAGYRTHLTALADAGRSPAP